MTTDDSSASSARPSTEPENPSELEARVAQLEAVVFAHSERLLEFEAAARARERRALWLRLVVLVLALVAFFALRSFGPGRHL